MIKTKYLYARIENYGKSDQKHIPLDEVINSFLNAANIDENRLIDIKLTPTGYFQENGDGEIEASALVIYKI